LKTGAIPHRQGSIQATCHATHTCKTSQEGSICSYRDSGLVQHLK
jgi:hypothetical protein